MPSPGRNPRLLGVVIVGVFLCVGAVIVVATTGSLWALIVAVGVLLLATLGVVGDVEWSLGDGDRPRDRPRRPRGSSRSIGRCGLGRTTPAPRRRTAS
jgi:hypothetical protein